MGPRRRHRRRCHAVGPVLRTLRRSRGGNRPAGCIPSDGTLRAEPLAPTAAHAHRTGPIVARSLTGQTDCWQVYALATVPASRGGDATWFGGLSTGPPR